MNKINFFFIFYSLIQMARAPTFRRVLYTAYDEQGIGFAEFLQAHSERVQAKINSGEITFAVFQHEECPETKRQHIQGLVCFDKQRGLRFIQELIGGRNAKPHVESVRDLKKAIEYCQKEDTRIAGPWQFGDPPEQGKRNDLKEITEKIAEGAPIAQIAREYPAAYVRNYRGLQALHNLMHSPKPRPGPKILYLYGPTGAGKSRAVREYLYSLPNVAEGREQVHYAKDVKEGWMDGYTYGTRTIVFNEFTGQYPRSDILELLDRGPLRLPVKGGFVTITANIFVILSNFAPDEVYSNFGMDPAENPWLRRLNEEIVVNVRGMTFPQIETNVKDFFQDHAFIE